MCGIIGIIARDMVASGRLLGGIAKLLGGRRSRHSTCPT